MTAKLRSVNTRFWEDSFIEDLNPSEKLIFIYLLTNPLTNILGIYEISIKRISYDTGINKEPIKKALIDFESLSKVIFHDGFIILCNFQKNQRMNPKMLKGAIDIFNTLPNSIKTIVSDSLSIAYQSILKGSIVFDKEERRKRKEEKGKNKEEGSENKKVYSDEIKNFTVSLSKNFSKSIIDKLNESQKISWIDTVDKLIRLDNYKKEEISKAVKNATNDSFWSKNFYSLNKLRKKNDKQDCTHMIIFLNLQNGKVKEEIKYSPNNRIL